MVAGRKLYQQIAEAASANARQLLRDSKRLSTRGSRGHASSLAILSIEESAKAIVFYMAAQGVFRIVKNKPNYVTTYRKEDLLDHRYKHAIISNMLSDAIFYAPFYAPLTSLRRKTYTREQVHDVVQRGIHAHKRAQIEFSAGKSGKDLRRMFELIGMLNHRKNRGFYVDDSKGKVLRPDELGRKELAEVTGVADLVVGLASEAVHEQLPAARKKVLVEEGRKLAAELRKMRKMKPPATTAASGA